MDPVTIFAGGKINSDDPKEVYEGLLALGAILIGPDKDFLKEKFGPAIDQLINLLGNGNSQVRQQTCWLFSLFASTIPDLLDREDTFSRFFDHMKEIMNSEEIAGGTMCRFICNFAEEV